MSIYKVIMNRYIEMLDYLRAMEKKYETLDGYFKVLSDVDELKRGLVDRLCDSTINIELAFSANKTYWQGKMKTQKAFITIFVMFIIIVFLVIVAFFINRKKEIALTSKPEDKSLKILQTAILYFIIYFILLSIFIILIMNVNGTKKLCKGQLDKLSQEAPKYLEYMIMLEPTENFYKVLLKYGYKRKNLKFKVDVPKNLLEFDTSTKIYTVFSNGIIESLKKFYNNGKGYLDVRKQYILSSPVTTMKEVNRIMDYYNYISIKKDDAKPSEEDNKNIINKIIIDQFNKILNKGKNSDPPDENAKSAIIKENENNNDFMNNMIDLIDYYFYLMVYIYPLYMKVNINDTCIPQDIIMKYPMNIDIKKQNAASGRDRSAFLYDVKNEFVRHHDSKYASYVSNSQTVSNISSVIQELLNDFVPQFKKMYYKVFLNLKGTYWFPFENSYMIEQKLTALFSTTSLQFTGDTYKNDILNLVSQSFIPTIQSTFDHEAELRAYIIEYISNSLIPYNINLLKYQGYIVHKLSDGNTNVDDLDIYNQLILDVDKTTRLKKQLRESTQDKKFLEPEAFITLIDNLSYIDLRTGLNTDNLLVIVNEFYNSISNSVNTNDNTLNNIYYDTNKLYKLWKTAVTFITVILIFIWLYFSIGLVKDFKNVFKLPPPPIESDNSEDAQKREAVYNAYIKDKMLDKKLNWLFKLTVPIFLIIFIIAMLFSVRKKSNAAYEFNKELIEINTSELKETLDALNNLFAEFNDKINPLDIHKKISLIDNISIEEKTDLFNLVKKVIDRYDKCNYILEAQKNKLPFPYTEVVINIFMLVTIALCFLYVYGEMNPIKRIYNIKDMNKLKEQIEFADAAQFIELKNQLTFERSVHDEDITTIIFTLKVIFFMFIVMFLIFYSTKVISSTSEFKMGLYNSAYYENSICYK